jgi:hypothetical protein
VHREESVPEQWMTGMTEHDQYEALCALAAGGLLDGKEFVDFHTHLKECSGCRSDYEELSGLVTRELPQAQGGFRQKLGEMRAQPLRDSRQRFLRRARAEGVVFSQPVDTTTRSAAWYFRPVSLLGPVAALVLVAISLTAYHIRGAPGAAQSGGVAAAQQIAELKRQNSALTSSLSQSNQTLALQQRDIQNLRAQLADAATIAENMRRNSEQSRGVASRSSSQNAQLLDEARNQEKLLTEARDEAARNSQLRINDEASLVEQQTRITELTNKLRVASATLDMERQLVAAGKDLPELMAARQLHVIDVGDTDASGNPRKAFGRVFLTEGNALTFYAFDLNEDRELNARHGFEVWAVPGAGKNSPRSLGFLHVDAKAQGRWVLKVENPELVKAISSIFVTAEPATGGKQPDGRKMLWAYLGEPNHP